METYSALPAPREENLPVTGSFPSQGQWRGALLCSLITAPGQTIEQTTENLAIVVVGPKTLLYIYIYIIYIWGFFLCVFVLERIR